MLYTEAGPWLTFRNCRRRSRRHSGRGHREYPRSGRAASGNGHTLKAGLRSSCRTAMAEPKSSSARLLSASKASPTPNQPDDRGARLHASADAIAIAEEKAAKEYGRAAKSSRTRTEYARDWAQFAACAERGLASLPASPPWWRNTPNPSRATQDRIDPPTRGRALSSHKERGFESATAHKLVREVVSGTRSDPRIYPDP
jgi:hypothetical protein